MQIARLQTMKESDQLRKEAAEDTSDNDQRDVGYLRKIERALKAEKFEEVYLPKLREKYTITGNYMKWTIETHDGIIVFYPKANSLYHKKYKIWIKPGLRWIIKNI